MVDDAQIHICDCEGGCNCNDEKNCGCDPTEVTLPGDDVLIRPSLEQ